MNYLLISLLLGLITITKAHPIVKLIILAALGLAGLWMIHNFSQNYNNNSGGGKFFHKRSIQSQHSEMNWDLVLSRDPVSCARSFICQLAGQDQSKLTPMGTNILELARISAEGNSWASKELNKALKNGHQANSPVQCMKIYKFCPYTSEMMERLIGLFGS